MRKSVLSFGLVITLLLLVVSIPVQHTLGGKPQNSKVALPGYPDYSPHGLPDFDQTQDPYWKNDSGHWSHCGPVSAANILWYFDSKHEDGYMGDGVSNYPLVGMEYEVNGQMVYSDDDHTPNVPWLLIQQLASDDYCGTNSWGGYYMDGVWSFTRVDALLSGLQDWIEDKGLKTKYLVYRKQFPKFEFLYDELSEGNGIMLQLLSATIWPLDEFWGHFVSITKIEEYPQKRICISDPFWDIDQPLPSRYPASLHNNASYVSHDWYTVSKPTFPIFIKLQIDEFSPDKVCMNVLCAIIVEELK